MSDDLDIDYEQPAQLPDDPEQARERVEWHARMVRHYHAVLDEETASFQREITRLKERLELRQATLRGRIDWHTVPVESYHRMRQREDAEVRTIRMPHATSKITVPKKPVINFADTMVDGDANPLLQWMTAYHPELLKLPGIAEIRKVVEVTNDGTDKRELIVVDKDTRRPVFGLVAEVPAPTYKLTPEEGAPL